MHKKIKAWIKRYLRAEIAGTISAIFFATLVFSFTKNEILAAYAGTWGENLGFYGVMITRNINASKKHHKNKNKHYSFFSLLVDIRNIILEFGPSEILDTFIIRPLMMYIFPKLIGDRYIGILLGKIAADIIFYIPTIISYELQQNYKKRRNN